MQKCSLIAGTLVGALLVSACTARESSDRSAIARDDVDSSSVVATSPSRIDTARTADGANFSPSYAWFSVTRAGRLVAIDQDDKRVMLFDSTGREQAHIGRAGAGPGEFRCPNALYVLTADSIAVWDACLRRATLFTPELKFARAEQFPRWNFRGESRPVGRLTDGRWVAVLRSGSTGAAPAVGVRDATDSARLIIGASNELPAEYVSLRTRSGLDVVTATSKDNFSVSRPRFEDLNGGYGAVCETGIVLVDTGGVHEIDARGKEISVRPLPRLGPLLTEADRDSMVNSMMAFRFDSMPEASEIRSKLRSMVGKLSRRMLKPTIDVDGQLWYRRSAAVRLPPISFDRVDVTGKTIESIALPNASDMQISRRTIGMMQFDFRTDGLLVARVQLPNSSASLHSSSLGRCSTSFTY